MQWVNMIGNARNAISHTMRGEKMPNQNGEETLGEWLEENKFELETMTNEEQYEYIESNGWAIPRRYLRMNIDKLLAGESLTIERTTLNTRIGGECDSPKSCKDFANSQDVFNKGAFRESE